MERIEVTTRFGMDGSLLPLEFSAGGQVRQVQDVGRSWASEDGRHVLVMDFQGTTYHLFLQRSDLSWYWVKDIKPSGNRI